MAVSAFKRTQASSSARHSRRTGVGASVGGCSAGRRTFLALWTRQESRDLACPSLLVSGAVVLFELIFTVSIIGVPAKKSSDFLHQRNYLSTNSLRSNRKHLD
jgi:hypothetical protein